MTKNYLFYSMNAVRYYLKKIVVVNIVLLLDEDLYRSHLFIEEKVLRNIV
ncbi:hypothetical protein [Cytobacillus sp. IB215665]|nr:hypothetical protein [Cytobacillus sp. IB215665]MDX8363817.1 hypothetical protein [Cytobacillus sp. IB215665]